MKKSKQATVPKDRKPTRRRILSDDSLQQSPAAAESGPQGQCSAGTSERRSASETRSSGKQRRKKRQRKRSAIEKDEQKTRGSLVHVVDVGAGKTIDVWRDEEEENEGYESDEEDAMETDTHDDTAIFSNTDVDRALSTDEVSRLLDDTNDEMEALSLPLHTPADRVFEFEDKAVLLLRPSDRVAVYGELSVCSLYGSVTVLGHRLRPSSPPCPLHSSASGGLLSLQWERAGDAAGGVRAALRDVSAAVADKVCDAAGDAPVALLLLRRLTSRVTDFVTAVRPYTQLYEYSAAAALSVPAVGVQLLFGTAGVALVEPMTRAAERFSEQLGRDTSPVIAVCGGTNTGKSTLTRYIVNHALNSCKRVAFLEVDVGQSEFTPSGCITLHILSCPLLGPPFTHQREPLRCCFFGGSSPGDEPRHYLQCLHYVFKRYADMKDRPALVVNTMGWIKGLGLDLLMETLCLVQPSIVVQIDGKIPSQNMAALTAQSLTSRQRWHFFEKLDVDLHEAEKVPSTEHILIKLNSCKPEKSHRKSRCAALNHLSAPELRDLALLAQLATFQRAGGATVPLSALTPLRVPWRHVAVGMCQRGVPASQILYTLNASVVALCRANKNTMRRSSVPGYPMFFDQPPVCQCLGFGVVRAIDATRKEFLVLTGLRRSQLAKVNCLLKGSLNIPPQVLLEQKLTGPLPYIGFPKNVPGANSVKKRRHLLRQTPN